MKLVTAGLLIIENRKLLFAYSKNKKCFYLPGGKVDSGETPLQALRREIKEELDVTLSDGDLEYYAHITAPAYGENDGIMMEQDCFFIKRKIEPNANAEISELKYFSLQEYLGEANRAPGAVKILELLKERGQID
ncbi:MAG TPA: NUDIX domain-containing protein [Chitinophagaceae bacterium]|nr:NUDIX domain-containing protein [Chitinophagaceae bacterium]